MISPASSAPTIGDSPTEAVARLAVMTTRRLAARKSSGLFVRAAWANMRGRIIRPRTSIASTVATPSNSVMPRLFAPDMPAVGASAPSRKMIGTIATSSNRSMARAARPTGDVVPDMGRTRAVEESARARPSPIAPPQFWPTAFNAVPMISAESRSSAAPTPKTSFRKDHNRLNESSSPMVNSNRMMPNSANGASLPGSLIVT